MWKRQRGPYVIFTLVEAASCRDAHLWAPACVCWRKWPQTEDTNQNPVPVFLNHLKGHIDYNTCEWFPSYLLSRIRHNKKHINVQQVLRVSSVKSSHLCFTSSRLRDVFNRFQPRRDPSLRILQLSANQPAILRYVTRKSQRCALLLYGRQIPGTYWCVSGAKTSPPLWGPVWSNEALAWSRVKLSQGKDAL